MNHAPGRPVLQVVIGSTRPGRAGLPVATWFAQAARQADLFDVEGCAHARGLTVRL